MKTRLSIFIVDLKCSFFSVSSSPARNDHLKSRASLFTELPSFRSASLWKISGSWWLHHNCSRIRNCLCTLRGCLMFGSFMAVYCCSACESQRSTCSIKSQIDFLSNFNFTKSCNPICSHSREQENDILFLENTTFCMLRKIFFNIPLEISPRKWRKSKWFVAAHEQWQYQVKKKVAA